MNVNNLIEKLLNLYHTDFESTSIICWYKEKIVIKWYSEEHSSIIIDTDITDKKDGIKLYEELSKHINFIQLSYELENLKNN